MADLLFYAGFIASIIAVIGGIPALTVAFRQLDGPMRRFLLPFIVALFVVSIVVMSVMEMTLRRTAAGAGLPIKGLIGEPVANGGGDHVYTPRGKEYEDRAFRKPFMVGMSLSAAVLSLSILRARGAGRRVVYFLLATAASSTGTMFLFWVVREFTAWDVFI